MTYETNLRTAQRLMTGLEMYSRVNCFMVEHSAFMAEPNEMTLRTLRNMIGRGNTTVKEDNHVQWVYEYYLYLVNDKDYNGATRINELRQVMRDLNDFRFPAPRSQAYYATLHRERMERLTSPRNVVNHYAAVLAGRYWHQREQMRGDIHNAVFRAWEMARPDDTDQLVMEWPRISKEGAHKIAYTRDEKYGEADRQLVTTVSKYLARHFTALASSDIRDIAALYVEAKIGIVRTMPEMMELIENGPSSCMSGGSDGFSGSDGRHPYEVYDPQYGWHMAYVKEGTRFTGRALLNDGKWVRTYRGDHDRSHSDTDERLNAWLKEEGYRKANGWSGFKIKRIHSDRNDCGFVAPYLDGDDKDVDVCRDSLDIVSSGDGEYNCTSTDGNADERHPYRCPRCDSRVDEDEMCSIGRHGDESVCRDCYENDYTVVYGRRSDQYAIPNDDAIEADGEYYDPDWLSDNGIVQLHDGDYTHEDNAVWIESASEYYPSESEYVCYTQAGENELRDDCVQLENGEWCLSDDAWCCDHTGDYYASYDETGVMTKCGKLIHPDHVDEYEMENDDATPVSAE